ncbi:MAG: radical SAM protein, partial [Phycisphaerae bacterium]
MELSQRKGQDRFLQPGQYRSLEMTLRAKTQFSKVRPLVISAFDRSTRMLPFVHFDWHMIPCGPRSIAGALHNGGLEKTRFA